MSGKLLERGVKGVELEFDPDVDEAGGGGGRMLRLEAGGVFSAMVYIAVICISLYSVEYTSRAYEYSVVIKVVVVQSCSDIH